MERHEVENHRGQEEAINSALQRVGWKEVNLGWERSHPGGCRKKMMNPKAGWRCKLLGMRKERKAHNQGLQKKGEMEETFSENWRRNSLIG